MPIRLLCLGAGQDVGRSCIVVSLGGRTVMLDCGMHMGYSDERRFPNFQLLSRAGDYTRVVDLVIVSHFHLDHCGALPYFTEMCGYNGPVVMTHPTKAIVPILLEDYRRITVDRKGESEFFSSDMVRDCVDRVTAVNLNETVTFPGGIEVRAYYAGHVLGAAMFHVSCGGESLVYTGDFNKVADRHLGPAWIDRCHPDVLITETTYATTIRDSKRAREREFLERIHRTVSAGGKVLVPVFALGRAQEIMLLIETYWQRLGVKPRVYFAAGMAQRANTFYRQYLNWTNEAVRNTFATTRRNQFEFEHIHPFDRSLLDSREPMVVLASPGMLHAGTSLEIFRRWAPDKANLVVIPGWCVPGTVGHSVLTGATSVEIDGRTVPVRCEIANMSFSAHADARGIMEVVRTARPRNVVLVHGDPSRMEFMRAKIASDLGLPCFAPGNGETIHLDTAGHVPATVISPNAADATAEYTSAETSRGGGRERKHIDDPRPVTSVEIDALLITEQQQQQQQQQQHQQHMTSPSSAGPQGGAVSRIVAADSAEARRLSHRLLLSAPVPSGVTPEDILQGFKSVGGSDCEPMLIKGGAGYAHRSVTVTSGDSTGEVRGIATWEPADDALAEGVLAELEKMRPAPARSATVTKME